MLSCASEQNRSLGSLVPPHCAPLWRSPSPRPLPQCLPGTQSQDQELMMLTVASLIWPFISYGVLWPLWNLSSLNKHPHLHCFLLLKHTIADLCKACNLQPADLSSPHECSYLIISTPEFTPFPPSTAPSWAPTLDFQCYVFISPISLCSIVSIQSQ